MEIKGIICCLCSAMTKTAKDLDHHILTNHPDIFRSVLDFPDGMKREESPENIEEPKKIETGDDDARQVTKNEDLLSDIGKKSVLVIVQGEQCLDCNFIATDATLLNNHVTEKHSKRETSLRPNAVKKHSKRAASLNPNMVGQKHSKKQPSSSPIKRKCPGCKKSFGSLPRLERHYQMFHSVEGKTCELCKKTFYDAYSRNRHFKEIHCEKKITQCPRCDETFVRFQDMKIHLQNIHHQISPESALLCGLCGKSFADSRSRKEHYQSVHNGNRCKCPECEKLCRSAWHLKSHRQSMHNEEGKVLPCLYCEKSFINFYSLGKHYKDSHGGKRINCPTFQKPLESI